MDNAMGRLYMEKSSTHSYGMGFVVHSEVQTDFMYLLFA